MRQYLHVSFLQHTHPIRLPHAHFRFFRHSRVHHVVIFCRYYQAKSMPTRAFLNASGELLLLRDGILLISLGTTCSVRELGTDCDLSKRDALSPSNTYR